MQQDVTLRTGGFIVSLLLAACGIAQADIGVPMLFVTLPAMMISLVPIIAVEAFILSRRLHLALRQTWKPVAAANIFSTLVGVPLTWLALALLEAFTGGGQAYGIATAREKFLAVTWQAPWLIPYDSDLHWMVPTAMLVLLVPFFFVSWLSEYQVARRMLPDVAPYQVNRGMLIANLASYVLLLVWVAGLFLTPQP